MKDSEKLRVEALKLAIEFGPSGLPKDKIIEMAKLFEEYILSKTADL